MNKYKFVFSTLILALAGFTVSAQAQVIDLDSGDSYFGGGPGNGRALGIQALENVEVSALGIYGDLASESYDVIIWSSTDGSQVGSILAQSSGASGGTGLGWNDLPISYTLQAGQYYVLHWQPTVLNNAWTSNVEYQFDSNLEFTVGPIRMLDGADGHSASSVNFGNVLHPHLRIGGDVVVEDATPVPTLGQWGLMMLIIVLLGFGVPALVRRYR